MSKIIKGAKAANPLIKKYGKEKRWVNYSMLPVKGRITKIPFSPITHKNASSTDAKTWGTYEEARTVNPDQLGIVFTPEQNLLGIDIDHCLEGTEIIHDEKEKIVSLIIEADTYTEISPSGHGLHLYFALNSKLDLSANRHGSFECYTSGRYFTVTGNSYKEQKEIRTIDPKEALALLAIIGYPWGKDDSQPVQNELATPKKEIVNETILEKIFASKGGKKIKALYDGDLSEYKNDASSADMALLAHLAFWTGKDAGAMEALWLASPLGAREKTQKRKDYRTRSITAAIKNCTQVYEATDKGPAAAVELDLLFNKGKGGDKIFIQNVENIRRILLRYPLFAGRFRYDLFKNALEYRPIDGRDRDAWRDLEDHDAISIQAYIQIHFPTFSKIGKEMVYDAIMRVSKDNTIDSAADYIRALVWDGTPRLDTWLSATYHVPINDYYKAAGANWMKGLIKRIIMPGCKFDYVLVLEGEQGIKKSTSLNIIGSVYAGQPSWHVETTMSTESKDFFMQFQGKAIIEFSEGETLSRTEVKRMKAIITMQSDKYRPAYGRLSVDFPRRCVFAMTTNQTEYLKDETGNRRWLPVACVGDADIAWLEENRDQIFAEAYERVINKKESTWEFPEEETFAMQSARRMEDPNTDLLIDWYCNKLKKEDREAGITIYQAYRDAICGGMTQKPLERFMMMTIADVFKSGLHLNKNRKMIDGIQSVRWFETEKTPRRFENPTPKSMFEQLTMEESSDDVKF